MEHPVEPTARTPQRAALIVATLSAFLGPFMSSSVNVALPSIGHEFGLGAVVLGWVNTAFLLAAASFSVPFGRLGDIYGRKKIFMTGVAVFTISSVLVANSRGGTALISFRVLQGFGASMIFATGMAILLSVFPAKDRGKVIGINVAAVYLGLSMGPLLGGVITEHLGWRYIFWLNLPVGVALMAVIFLMLKGDWTEGRGASFDLLGSVIMGLSLLFTMYGFSKLPAVSAFALLAAGVLGIVVFVAYESKLEHPLIDIKLFRSNTVFAMSNLAALINYAATFAVSFLLSLYLQKVRGLSPQSAGLVMVSQPLVQAAISPAAGKLSDRIEPRVVASIGMALTLVGLVFLSFVGANTPLYYVVACLVFLGVGFALFSSPNTNAVMSSVDRRVYGVASAVLGTMRQLGMMFSMGFVMMILALHMGKSEIGPSNVGQFLVSMKTAFTVFAAMCLGGLFASFARGSVKRSA